MILSLALVESWVEKTSSEKTLLWQCFSEECCGVWRVLRGFSDDAQPNIAQGWAGVGGRKNLNLTKSRVGTIQSLCNLLVRVSPPNFWHFWVSSHFEIVIYRSLGVPLQAHQATRCGFHFGFILRNSNNKVWAGTRINTKDMLGTRIYATAAQHSCQALLHRFSLGIQNSTAREEGDKVTKKVILTKNPVIWWSWRSS